MNLDVITLQDCMDLYKFRRRCTVINDGSVIGFTGEEVKEETKY